MTTTQKNNLIASEFVVGTGTVTTVIWEGDEDWSIIHDGPLHDFTRSIIEKKPPLTGLKEAYLVQQALELMYRSACTGKATTISERIERL